MSSLEQFVTGTGKYLDDLRLSDMLSVAFIRSEHPHAHIRSMRLPGQHRSRLVKGAELKESLAPLRIGGLGLNPYDWYALSDKALYVGEPIGLIYADNRYVAEDIAAEAEVDYEELPPVTDVHNAMVGDVLVHPEVPNNILFRRVFNEGQSKDVFSGADVVVEGTFHYARQTAAPLEARGTIAQFDADTQRLTLWTSTQTPWFVRSGIAEALQLPEESVRVISPDIGGAFGQKSVAYAEDIALAWLARHLGRPVKWVEDRKENLISAQPSHEAEIHVKAAADKDGRLLGVKAQIIVDCGAHHVYPVSASIIPMTATTALFSVYRLQTAEIEAVGVATNKTPLGSYRGVGMNAAVFASERIMDMLAYKLGIDPADIRLRNLLTEKEFPYKTALGKILDSGDYKESLEVALSASGYRQRRKTRQPKNSKLHGVGIACFNEHSGTGSRDYAERGISSFVAYDSALMRISKDGLVEVRISTVSSGQGHDELIKRLVSSRLGVDRDHITVLSADTELCPEGFGTGVDRSAIGITGAVSEACDNLVAKMTSVARSVLQTAKDMIFKDGVFTLDGEDKPLLTFSEFVKAASRNIKPGGPSEGEAVLFEALGKSDLERQVFPNGVHIAFIELDSETAELKVTKYVVVADCGRILDRSAVEQQLIGGIGQGIGCAVLEEVVYDENGQILTGSLMDYLVPVSTDMPEMDVRLIEHPSPFTREGVKGVGQMGIVASGAAVANAVADALGLHGAEPNKIPLTSERIFRLLIATGHTSI